MTNPSEATTYSPLDAWWLADTNTPLTELQAIMEAPSGTEPVVSIEELHAQETPALTAALGEAMEALQTHKPHWYEAMMAVSIMGQSVRTAAKELGTTKSTAHRRDIAARQYLEDYLTGNPIIAQHVTGIAPDGPAWTVDDETGEPF